MSHRTLKYFMKKLYQSNISLNGIRSLKYIALGPKLLSGIDTAHLLHIFPVQNRIYFFAPSSAREGRGDRALRIAHCTKYSFGN